MEQTETEIERSATIKRRSIEAPEAEVEAAAIKRNLEKDQDQALKIVKKRIERDQSPAQENIDIEIRTALEEEAVAIKKEIEMETEIEKERSRIMMITLI